MRKLVKEWEACDKIKLLEIAVTDKKTGGETWVVFDISVQNGQFIAQHESLNSVQAASEFISSVKIDIDTNFSLDGNLQALYEACTDAVQESEYFEMRCCE